MSKCNKCGKEMEIDVSGSKTSIIGISSNLQEDMFTKIGKEHLQRQAGDYKVGKRYELCWECMLKGWGFKP